MSSTQQTRGWGPSHEHRPPPGRGGRWLKLGAISLIVVFCELLGARLGGSTHNPFRSAIHATAAYALAGVVLFLAGRAVLTGRLHLPFVSADRSPAARLSD